MKIIFYIIFSYKSPPPQLRPSSSIRHFLYSMYNPECNDTYKKSFLCLSHDEKLISHTRRYSNCIQSHAKLLNLVSRGLNARTLFIERFIQVNNLTIARTGISIIVQVVYLHVYTSSWICGMERDMLITLYISRNEHFYRCFGLRSEEITDPWLSFFSFYSFLFLSFFFSAFVRFSSETMNFSLARAKQARVTDVTLIHRKGCSARRENHISDVSVIAFISAARDWQCRHNQFFSRAQGKIGPLCWIDLSANDSTAKLVVIPPRWLDLSWNACG